MASTASLLQTLVLTASEIKELTGWPDAMVEDYLNLLIDIITLANSVDDSSQSAVIGSLFPVAEVNGDGIDITWVRVREGQERPLFVSPQAGVEYFSVGANHTTAGDEIIIATSNITVSLNAEPDEGERVTVKRNTAAGTVTIDPQGSTIDGAANYQQVINYEANTFIYTGEWLII